MPSDPPAAISPEDQQRLYQARVFRLTVGLVLATAVAFGIGWPFAFFTPMLTATFLMAPVPRPTFGAILAFPVMILAALLLAFGVSAMTLSQPILSLVVVMLMVFRCFYLMSLGVSRAFLTWVLLGFLMIPAMGVKSLDLAMSLTTGLFGCGLIAMVFVWLAHALVPDPVGVTKPSPVTPPPMDWAQRNRAAKNAFLRVLVILPLEAYVLIGQNTGDLKILIFAAMLIQSPSLTAGLKGGRAMIMGNTFGGVTAMVFYELLVKFPSFPFLLMLFALLALVFGRQIFGGTKWGPVCSGGLGTVIVLIGLGTMPFGGEVDDQFYSRIWQVILAAVYVVFAFHLGAYISRWKERRSLKKSIGMVTGQA